MQSVREVDAIIRYTEGPLARDHRDERFGMITHMLNYHKMSANINFLLCFAGVASFFAFFCMCVCVHVRWFCYTE